MKGNSHSMSTYERVIELNKKATLAIKRSVGNTTARNLHEATDLIENDIPQHIVKKLRFLATIRNKLVNKDGFGEEDIPHSFLFVAKDVVDYLHPYLMKYFNENVRT